MKIAAPSDRRGGERRNVATRRRHADTRSVFIELCHSVLRVVIVVDDEKAERPKLTAKTVRWRHDAADLRSDQGLLELAAALKTLVGQERLAGCRVSFAISSTLCVNRAASGATARVEQEIANLRERSQLYLTLGRGAKITAVGRKPIDARHEHALMTVANEETLQLLLQATEAAGLVVDVVESSLVALGRLYGLIGGDEAEPALLVQLDEDRFEVGVSCRGQLLLEYRPSADATVADLGRVIDDHHERLERFCNRAYGLGRNGIEQMWLVGEPDEVRQTDAKTETELIRGVLDLSAARRVWDLADDAAPSAEMAAAVGVALLDIDDHRAVTPNLMEEIHARAKPPLRPFLIRALTPIAATLLLAAGLGAFNYEQRLELAALRAESDRLRPAATRLRKLSGEIRAADIELEHLGRLVTATPATRLDATVQDIAHCLPGDVWLKQLRLDAGASATLSGTSYTEGGVYDFVHHLEEAPLAVEVALRGTGVEQTRQGPATSFEVEVALAPTEAAAPPSPAPNTLSSR